MKIKLLSLFMLVSLFSCTDLDEELRQDISFEEFAETQNVDALLEAAYRGLELPFMDQSRFWAAQQHTTDETIGPTRGPDWDDNGIWRVLHDHTWDADHAFLGNTFNELLQVVFTTTNLLQFGPDASQEAQARFLRAFVMLSIVDGWDQVPFREVGENLLNPPSVLSGPAAVDFVISEVNEIMNDLPDGPAYVANKDAAKVLLMKAALNKGTYSNRANPTFDGGDMNTVISNADAIINSGKYSLDDVYFDNFAPDNNNASSELIYTGESRGGERSGNVASRWMCGLHYAQNPSGWNGFTTLGDFYMSFEDDDQRKSYDYPGMKEVAGINSGFLFGQQVDAEGNELMDRKGNKLAFTKEVDLVETGDNLEITGVRVMKYVIDYDNPTNPVDNDYVFYRYADVLLMKAEALLRTGDEAGARALVNEIRSARGTSELSSLDLDELLAERGRELYWEGHRRTDLIRFGRFLDAWQEKPASGPERLLFPIPATALSVNPNLQQNPGY